MLSMFMRRRINHDLAKLERAKQRHNGRDLQKAYEDLFTVCRQYHLDLTAILRGWEMHHSSQAA